MTVRIASIAMAVRRAGGDMDDVGDLVATWERLEADQAGRVERLRYDAQHPRCCCDPGWPARLEGGRCSRCWGLAR